LDQSHGLWIAALEVAVGRRVEAGASRSGRRSGLSGCASAGVSAAPVLDKAQRLTRLSSWQLVIDHRAY
jgi:hypothetical protein